MWAMVLPGVAVLQPCRTGSLFATVLSSYHNFVKASNQNKFQVLKLHYLESEIPPVHYNPVLSTAFPQVRLHNTYETWILKLFLWLFIAPLKHCRNSLIYGKKENPEQGSSQNTYPHKTKLECWYSSMNIWKKSKMGFHIYSMSFWITIRKCYHISLHRSQFLSLFFLAIVKSEMFYNSSCRNWQ